MGYLLKEALKTLCGVNQWSYAVFWKFGFKNPTLLIWEDFYYEPMPCSALPLNSGIKSSELAFREWEECWVSSEPQSHHVGVRAEDKVPSLVNKMMLGNRVQVVGQGLVGRAAFTGNHMWILSENYTTETHPPEVQNELWQQLSAGIKTVAIIPILTHGVVQLGSSLSIMENAAFVNDVKSLILQLGCVPGALLSENYTSGEPAPKIGVPIFHRRSVSACPSGNRNMEDSVPSIAGSCNQQSIQSHASEFVGQPSYSIVRMIQNNLHGTSSSGIKPSFPFSSQFENVETGGEFIPLNQELWLNHQASLYNHKSEFDEQTCAGLSSGNYSNLRIMEEEILSDAILQEHVNNSLSTSNDNIMSQLRTNGGLSSNGGQLHNAARNQPRSISNSCSLPTVYRSASVDISSRHLARSGPNAGSSKTEVSTSDLTDHLTSNQLLLRSSDFKHNSKIGKCSQIEVAQRKERIENDLFQGLDIPLAHLDERTKLSENISGFDHDSLKHDYRTPRSKSAKTENKCVQPSSGDDLFDILGVDFKNKLIDDSWNNCLNGGLDTRKKTLNKNNFTSLNLRDADAELYSLNGRNSDCGIFSMSGTDHLLDAVVNGVHTAANQSSDDNVSCRTTVTKISSLSVLNTSSSHGRVSVSDQIQEKLLGLPKSQEKLAPLGSCSFKSECSKEDPGNYSQTSSICGSQISSWVEQSHGMKHNSSASIAHPKRPDEVSKSNRKRLKPGENPRPRPKDRQMIQDRMKELREIVPNGAKCSIDALLERTIKHMLFLQSVTKHADKLKQTGVSKVINKDGGPLLKDNFEGGRTWACEVGSQSMVFPIIVEDLNPPRQMLVEMLCEERGLFLEIADIIRGLGLTILKGVMETRNDKVWARFAVEANRDVTRVEIFISLIQLLEQSVKSSAIASGNTIENDNMIVLPSFQQAASIPVTGMPHSLQ
ncbi:hypothetical protein CsSME_00046737 [Camellia sinensis var. sinensis]